MSYIPMSAARLDAVKVSDRPQSGWQGNAAQTKLQIVRPRGGMQRTAGIMRPRLGR